MARRSVLLVLAVTVGLAPRASATAAVSSLYRFDLEAGWARHQYGVSPTYGWTARRYQCDLLLAPLALADEDPWGRRPLRYSLLGLYTLAGVAIGSLTTAPSVTSPAVRVAGRLLSAPAYLLNSRHQLRLLGAALALYGATRADWFEGGARRERWGRWHPGVGLAVALPASLWELRVGIEWPYAFGTGVEPCWQRARLALTLLRATPWQVAAPPQSPQAARRARFKAAATARSSPSTLRAAPRCAS